MENIELILSFIGTVLGLTITTMTFLIKFIKSVKNKKKCEEMIKISNIILAFIENAEDYINYRGVEKKEYVMTKARQFANLNKIKVTDEFISEKIEELIDLTKKVNTLPKKNLLIKEENNSKYSSLKNVIMGEDKNE